MNRILIVIGLLVIFFSKNKLAAQCPLASSCAAACVVCDLNGYTGSANQPIMGQMPPGYCTQVQHTMHWIGFIAGSTNLTISVSVFNCLQNGGLEMGIYESSDCSTFNLVSNCNTNMFNNNTWTFSNFVPLTIGNTYYLVFDANGPNACDISVSVTNGSTQAPPIDDMSIINGPLRICRGASADYIASTVNGASRYIWTWDGAPIGQGLQVSPPTFVTGTHQLCIEPSNNCNDGQPTCIDVEVYDIPATTVYDTICIGDCYSFQQNTYCSPGIYPHSLTSWQGCDSLVLLDLYGIIKQVGQEKDTICQGDTLWYNNIPYASTGVHQVTIPGPGCDSTVILDLTVQSAMNSYEVATICDGDSYVVGDSIFRSSGNYTVRFPQADGCDSLVYVDLSVIPIPRDTILAEICENSTCEVGDSTFNVDGVYTVPIRRQNGCDSIVRLGLTVNPIYDLQIQGSICEGDVFMVGDSIVSQSGNYTFALQSGKGCDSIINLQLEVNPLSQTLLDTTLCAGGSFQVGDSLFDSGGNYQVLLTNGAGCDSLVELTLGVAPVYFIDSIVQICEGDQVSIGNDVFDQAGLYTVTLQSEANCDSTILLDLTVLDAPDTSFSFSICEGESVSIGDSTFTSTGNFVVPFQTQNFCDSVVIVDLEVRSIVRSILDASICFGDSILMGSQFYNQTGQYIYTTIGQNGCDSITTLNLDVRNKPSSVLPLSICAGDSVEINGQTFTDEGDYEVVLADQFGCDSTVYLQLNEIQPVIADGSFTICRGDSVTAGGRYFYDEGYYSLALVAASGCDSVYNLDLQVVEPQFEDIQTSICEGELFPVADTTLSITGNYLIPTTAVSGCDSFINVDLTVNPLRQTDLNIKLCYGEDYVVGNQVYDDPGSYSQVLSTANGCDSTVNLNLAIRDSISTAITATICAGDIFDVSGYQFTTAGYHRVPLQAVSGCDSVIHLTLLVENCALVPVINSFATSCFDAADGQFEIGFSNAIFPVNVSWSRMGLMGDTILNDYASILIVNNLVAGDYTITIQDSLGASITQLVTITQPPPISFDVSLSIFGDFEIDCKGNATGYALISPAGGTGNFDIIWDDGDTTNPRTELQAGTYVFVLSDGNDCESQGLIELTEPDSISFVANAMDPTCHFPEEGYISLEAISGGNQGYSIFINGDQIDDTSYGPVSAGFYRVVIEDAYGCSADKEVILNEPNYPYLDAGPDLEVLLGDSVLINARVFSIVEIITWLNPENLNCADCLTPYARPAQDETVFISVQDANGCTTTDSVFIRVRTNTDVFVPSGFSPNGDGINDGFTLYGGANIANIKSMTVFDRWGNAVFEKRDFLPNNPLNGWQGDYRGKLLDPGVFVYLIEVEFFDGTIEKVAGDVTLVSGF